MHFPLRACPHAVRCLFSVLFTCNVTLSSLFAFSQESEDKQDSSAIESSGSEDDDAVVEGEQADRPTDSQIRARSAAQALRRKVTDKATIQPHELINREPMQKLPNRPMVELEAQSNVWYSARVVKESASEIKLQIGELAAGLSQSCGPVHQLQVQRLHACISAACWRRLFGAGWLSFFSASSPPPYQCHCPHTHQHAAPRFLTRTHHPAGAAIEGEPNKTEWIKRSSSRIWRGSLKMCDWRHLGRGAWAPRSKPSRKGRRSRRPNGQPRRNNSKAGRRACCTDSLYCGHHLA